MLANVNSDLLPLVMMGVHQDPLNQIVAILIPRNVNERNTRTVRMCSGNNAKIALKELHTTNLQTLFDNFGGKLIDAVAVGIAQNVVNDSALVWRGAMLAKMLNAPVAELPVRNEINVGDDFLDGRALGRLLALEKWMRRYCTYLFLFNTVFEDVLDHQTTSLSKSDFVPHAPKSFVHFEHDLWRFAAPA